jgi:hypothetical protein
MFTSTGTRTQRPSSLPSASKVFFGQATVPIGWKLDTTHNDKAIRILNTVGGSSSGSVAFSTLFGRTTTDGFSLTLAYMGNHTHSAQYATYLTNLGGNGNYPFNSDGSVTGSDNTNSGGNVAHAHGAEMRVFYVDLIIGQKN